MTCISGKVTLSGMSTSRPDPAELLRRLDGEPADAIESQFVEFKSWNQGRANTRSQLKEVRETVVAFANAAGGVLLLGVADGKQTRADAIHGAPNVDLTRLAGEIYNGTDPPILVDVSELHEPEGRVIVLRIPPGVPPHTTTDGVGKVRVGKESKPLTGRALTAMAMTRGHRDMTAEPIPDVGPSDLDPREIQRLRRLMVEAGDRPNLAGLGDLELLEAVGLVGGGDVSLAAVLLVGTQALVARWAPVHEVIFTRRRGETEYLQRRDIRLPMLSLLDEVQRLVEANVQIETVQTAGFVQLEIPDISWQVARESLLNALVHRDYFLQQSIHLDLFADRIEVTNPGGFFGGVTAENILRHPPVRRNPLLGDVLQASGLVNRLALGVDRIYEELLQRGKDVPRYREDGSSVKLVLPTRTDAAFARFVYEARRGGEELGLDDLIVLRGVRRAGSLDRWSAAGLLQLSEADAAERLIRLRERGFLVPQGRGRSTVYRFAERYRELTPSRGVGEAAGDGDALALRQMILAELGERERLANADIRQLSGLSRAQVHRMLKGLRDEGLVEARGWGRGAHYVLSDASDA